MSNNDPRYGYGNRKRLPHEHVCKHCSKVFSSRELEQKYCSRQCTQKARWSANEKT